MKRASRGVWVLALTVLGATGFSQTRNPPTLRRDAGAEPRAADAGVTRASVDAGRPVEATAQPEPRTEPAVNPRELERLRRELIEVRERTTALERQALQTERLSDQLDKLSKQIEDLKSHVTQNEERRAESERQVAERRAATDAVITALGNAQQTLSTGATNIQDTLRAAEAVLTGAALHDVQAAKVALANNDLANARVWLTAAILDAQAAR